VLDLNIYKGSAMPDDGLPQIAKALGEVQRVLKSWTHRPNGLRVYNSDAERHEGQVRKTGKAHMAEESTTSSTAPDVPEDVIAEPDAPQI
jgi:hypothetical protein